MTTSKSSYLKGEETLLHYIVREPKIKHENPPLLVLLHGVGSNENDLFSFSEQLPENFLIISARAPYEMSAGSYAWYEVDFSTGKPVINKEKAEKSRNIIIQFINQLKEKHRFDDKKVYLCGFSQGSIMAYSVGLTRPDKIKGIAVMSGRLLEEVKPLVKESETLKKLSVYISHGSQDNVLPAHYASESITYLKSLGITPIYKEYIAGHTITSPMLSDLITWLKTSEY